MIVKYFNDLIKASKLVFQKPAYLVLALIIALVIFLISIFIPNIDFVRFTIGTEIFTVAEKLNIISKQLGGFVTFFTLGSQITLVIVALLAGVNISWFVFYLKRRFKDQRAGGVGLLGIFIGLFGVGCTACGSVLLSALIGAGATGQLIGFLPFHGAEFSIIAIILILLANIHLASKIVNPNVCKI